MAVFAVRIVMREDYMGRAREFGNTWHYKADAIEPFSDEQVATAIRDQFKKLVSSEVEFIRWETWGPTDGDPLNNVMRERAAFPTVQAGLGLANPSMYREVCAVLAWPLPRSQVYNTRRWLRKFVRMPALATSVLSPDVMSGRIAIPAALKTELVTVGNTLKNIIAAGGTYDLCNKFGVETTGDALARDFLVTRDIGR